jgi:preprotein translocase subunit YajC
MFDLFIPVAHAQAAAGGGSALGALLFPVLMLVVFYFFLIRPQMKRAKDHKNMISELKVGDEVLTNGGIISKIVNIKDNSVDIEVANNVIIKIQKGSIAGLLPKGSLSE